MYKKPCTLWDLNKKWKCVDQIIIEKVLEHIFDNMGFLIHNDNYVGFCHFQPPENMKYNALSDAECIL